MHQIKGRAPQFKRKAFNKLSSQSIYPPNNDCIFKLYKYTVTLTCSGQMKLLKESESNTLIYQIDTTLKIGLMSNNRLYELIRNTNKISALRINNM